MTLSWRDELEGMTYDDIVSQAADNPEDFAGLVIEMMLALNSAEVQVDTLRGLIGLK